MIEYTFIITVLSQNCSIVTFSFIPNLLTIFIEYHKNLNTNIDLPQHKEMRNIVLLISVVNMIESMYLAKIVVDNKDS